MTDLEHGSASAAAGASSAAAGTVDPVLTGASDTVRQTVVETMEAPRLQGMTTAHFIDFKEKRKIYERRVAEKNAASNVNVQLTTYQNSMPRYLLKLLILGDLVQANSPEEVTEDQLKSCVEKQSTVLFEDYDLDIIENELKDVKFSKLTGKTTLETAVVNLFVHYTATLERCGYDQFLEKKPALAIEHILKRVSHHELQSRMLSTIKLNKSDGFKKDFKRFFKQIMQEAKQIDRRELSMPRGLDALDSDEENAIEVPTSSSRGKRGKKGKKNKKNDGEVKKPTKESRSSDSGRSNKPKRSRELPDCLNSDCAGKHFIVDCPNSTEEQKKKFKNDYHEAKRARLKAAKKGSHGNVGQISGETNDESSSQFAATFCNGAVEVTLLADQGSDANLISPAVLQDVLHADRSVKTIPLPRTLFFYNAKKKTSPIACSKQVKLDVMLRVRHGTNLILRSVKWLVSDDEIDNVIIGRHVLSALGLNNRTLLAAACDRFEGIVDVPDALQKDGAVDAAYADGTSPPAIHSILQDREVENAGTFHSRGGYDDDSLEDSDVYVDLGEDPPEMLTKALKDLVLEAEKNGLSAKGSGRLTKLLKNHESIFEFGWENPHQPTFHQ